MKTKTSFLRICLVAAYTLAAVPAAAQTEVALTIQDARGQPIPDAVVFLTGQGIHGPGAPQSKVINQVDKQFVPEISVVQRGTTVEFGNSDNISHHVYSFAEQNAFEVPLFKGKLKPRVRFDNPGVVTLGCNIHDLMLGYIIVVDSPWFEKTDAAGVANLSGVLPGEYQLQLWARQLEPTGFIDLGRFVVTPHDQSMIKNISLKRRARDIDTSVTRSLAWDDY